MYFYLYDNKDFKIFIEKQMYTLPFKFTARVRCPVFITGNHDQFAQTKTISFPEAAIILSADQSGGGW